MIGSLVVVIISLSYLTGWYFGYKQGKREGYTKGYSEGYNAYNDSQSYERE